MQNQRTIATLREHLFKQLELLDDPERKPDVERARLVADLSQVVINSVKVEVDLVKVLKGAVTLPFIENQADHEERPHPSLTSPQPPENQPAPTAEDRMQRVLSSGPAEDHPWRGLGSRVHRLEH